MKKVLLASVVYLYCEFNIYVIYLEVFDTAIKGKTFQVLSWIMLLSQLEISTEVGHWLIFSTVDSLIQDSINANTTGKFPS